MPDWMISVTFSDGGKQYFAIHDDRFTMTDVVDMAEDYVERELLCDPQEIVKFTMTKKGAAS